MSTTPTTLKLSDLDEAGFDLENALTQIFGLAKVLCELGVHDEVTSYLGSRLQDHYEVAQDAFGRIFGLGEDNPQKSADAEKGGAA